MLPSNHLAILSHLQRIIFMSRPTTQTGQTALSHEYVLACNKSQETDIVQMNNKKQDKEPLEEVSVPQ